jgi:chromosome segregation ATPase
MSQSQRSIEDISTQIDSLQKRYATVLRRKAELGGALKAKRDELESLVKEIEDAGYNPKTLVDDRNKAQTELEQLVSSFESDLSEAEKALSAYDKK